MTAGGASPEPAEPGGPLERLVGFGRYLRHAGLLVETRRVLTFCRAATVLDPFDREDLYWAGRATLVARREDIEPFDHAFDAYFGGRALGHDRPPVPGAARGQRQDREDPTGPEARAGMIASRWNAAGEGEDAEGEAALRIVASEAEILRNRSFAELTEEERHETAALIRRLEVQTPRRQVRRHRPAAKGPRFDLPRTIRRSLRTEGEPFRRAWQDRTTRLRPLVLLLDVSGSMGPYSRALMQFAYAAMAAGGKVEVFCFGTRLTRVTRILRTRDPDRALREIGREVEDWEGGTRIGESIKALLDRWSQRTALRGAVVVLCSDGLERGDPELLAQQMGRLGRLAHKVVWVNPLKGSPAYEPLARGMAAALPHVDVFLPGHNLESLASLGLILSR
jgi:uncharacterized protein with von Willebrand factor type A (vWA) domain